MTFYMRNFTSEEKFDISKFLNFENGVYDVLDSPFLQQLHELQTVDYYNVDDGYKDIDMIATDYYDDQFFAYLIQFYNNDYRDFFPEGTKLRMFSVDDLNELFYKLSVQSNINLGEE